jgi:hypothetical protein
MLMSLLDLGFATLRHLQQFGTALKLVHIEPTRLLLSLGVHRGPSSFALDGKGCRFNLVSLGQEGVQSAFCEARRLVGANVMAGAYGDEIVLCHSELQVCEVLDLCCFGCSDVYFLPSFSR